MKRVVSTVSAATFLSVLSSAAWAQRDTSRWEDVFSDHPSTFRVKYDHTQYFEEGVKGQEADFSLFQEELWASGRVWGDGQNEVWLQGGLRLQEIETEAALPDTGQPFPDELWDVRAGATYRHVFDPGKVLGGAVDVGSASDHPFHSSREIVESILLFFRLPSGERDAWLFFLAYSNNREYANYFPIPGVEYFYNPSTEFHAMVGFPMESLEWRPTEGLSFSFRYSLIHNIHALATYRLAEPLRAYAGFDWNTQGYLLVDRPDVKDRFFYDEKRAKGGVKITVIDGLVLDLSAGYAFDRSYWQSEHGFRMKFDRVDIQSGLFALVSLEIRLGRAEGERKAQPEKKE